MHVLSRFAIVASTFKVFGDIRGSSSPQAEQARDSISHSISPTVDLVSWILPRFTFCIRALVSIERIRIDQRPLQSFSSCFNYLYRKLILLGKNTCFQKGPFPQQIWLKICVWNPKNLPDLNSRAGKWDFFGPKISLRVGVLKKAEITPEAQGCPPQPAPLQKSPLQGIHPCQEIFTGYPSLSRSFYRISIPVKKFLQDISWIYPSLSRIFYRIFTPAKHIESNILVPISDAYKPHYHNNRPWHCHQYNPQTLSGNSRGPDSSSSEQWTHGSNMGLSGKQNLRLCESYFPEHFRIIIGCVKIIEAHFNLKQKSSGTVGDEN